MDDDVQLNDRMARRLRAWSDELMSLDRRNRLLYFKHVRTASLEIGADPQRLLATLRATRGGLQLCAGLPPEPDQDAPEVPAGAEVVANKNASDLVKAIKRLDAAARMTFVDRGVWSLYLGLGMLEWRDLDDQPAASPLLLVPVELVPYSGSDFLLKPTVDEAVVNPALVQMLAAQHHLVLADGPDTDLDALVADARELTAGRDAWRVTDRAVLANFSFHKEAMYRDLREHSDTIAAHPIIQLLALGADAPSLGQYDFQPHDLTLLDDIAPPEILPAILDADATQRRCVVHAREGRSFVMDGPPGTGKSQTITNVIAALIADGKSVLFVSEKMAALDVVRNRLAEGGLGEFVLELHSHKATRKEVATRLGAALRSRPRAREQLNEGQRHAAAQRRQLLSSYADALNAQRSPIGLSLFAAYDLLAGLPDLRGYVADTRSTWADLPADRFDSIASKGDQLSRVWSPVDHAADWLWRDLKAEGISPNEVVQHRDVVDEATRAHRELSSLVDAVDADLGWSMRRDTVAIDQRLDTLGWLDHRPQTPAAWLSDPDFTVVRSRVEHLAAAAGKYRLAADWLSSTVGSDWHLIDGSRRDAVDTIVASLGERQPHLSVDQLTRSQLQNISQMLRQVGVAIPGMADDARTVDVAFGLENDRVTLARCAELAELGRLTGVPAKPDPSWFNPVIQQALTESHQVLGELVAHIRVRQESLETVFTPAVLQLDIGGLHQRFSTVHRGLRRWTSAARQDRRALGAATVRGKTDRLALARLEEARDWQDLESKLDRAETEHASRLGGYYERIETDFARAGRAIDVAQRALQIVGAEIDRKSLSRQLGDGGSPDPELGVRADRLGRSHTAMSDVLAGAFGEEIAAALDRLTLHELRTWCGDSADFLDSLAECLEQIDRTSGRAFQVSSAQDALRAADDAAAAYSGIYDDYEDHSASLGPRFAGLETDWAALDADLRWADELRARFPDGIDEYVAERMMLTTIRAAEIRPSRDGWHEARQAVCDLFVGDSHQAIATELAELDLAGDLLTALSATAEEQIPVWDSFHSLRAELGHAGLSGAIERAMSSGLPRDRVSAAIQHAMLEAWTHEQTVGMPELAPLAGADRDALVADFRARDRELVRAAHVDIINTCSDARPRSIAGETALISRQSTIKSRHLPIRTLMERAGNAAKRLTPCFMMSPLSVSQYLPSTMQFDVVVFDEASQVLPSDAINCVYRGKQLIVAGDDRQLPPTRFFDRQVEGDETDDDANEFESVLTLSKGAGGLRSLPLLWHYRSRHEALITFSNRSFYDGNLQTFPGAAYRADDLGVAVFPVDGIYHRGGSRDNPIEAEEVAERVIFHHERHPQLSVGVVTFNTEQADAVRFALEERVTDHPWLASMLSSSDRLDGFFVKSLESVQGDERDVIIFTLGYGQDSDGRLSMNFGPLNRDGGWRRLNVAVTRARRRVELITSLKPSDFGEPSNRSVRHLRDYVAYAFDVTDRPTGAHAVQSNGRGPTLTAEITELLRSWGHEVSLGVGLGEMIVDVAVHDPDRPGSYQLGVLVDGPRYAATAVARDRDRLHAQVLESLGWRLHRAWSPAWVLDRAGAEGRLRAALHRIDPAIEEPHQSDPVEIDHRENDFDGPPDWSLPYRRGRGSVPRYEEPTYVGSRPALRRYLEQVVSTESPVHEDVLSERVRDDWSLSRVTPALRAAVREALAGSSMVRVDGTGIAFDDRVKVIVRHSGDGVRRQVKEIAPAELDRAIEHVVRDAGTVGFDDLLVAVRNAFGWDRAGSEIRAAVQRRVAALVSNRTLDEEDGTYAGRG